MREDKEGEEEEEKSSLGLGIPSLKEKNQT